MNILLTRILIVFAFSISQLSIAQDAVSSNDLSLIFGEWEGTLTYMDYSTNKPYSMPVNVSVEEGKNKYEVKLLFSYPKEPNANSKEKIKISKDGMFVNKTEVKSRQILENQEIQITTESQGKDNNKNASIKNIYILGKERFITRKEVKFDNSEEWIIRNEYKFSR